MGSLDHKGISRDLLYCSLILVFSILICLPLFSGQFQRTDDYAGTLMRLLSMKQCLGQGQWVVRWVPQLYGGFGYPLFNFYPPLFYLLGVLIAQLGGGIVVAVNLSLFVVVLFSGLAMYLFAGACWGREGGFIAATAYLFAPYHIVDLYLRGAAAEVSAFVFLPLILWSFYQLSQTSRWRYFLCSAFACAALLLTHNCISLIVFPWLPIYIFILYWPYSFSGRWLSLFKSLLALAFGVALAAFFWLPALIEKRFVQLEHLTQGYLNVMNNFVTVNDLLGLPWGNRMPFFVDQHKFCQIGLVHLLLLLAVLIGIRKIVLQVPRFKIQLVFLSVLLAGAIVHMLTLSRSIWEAVHILQFLQFPFRLLTIVVFTTSFLAGGFVLLVSPKHRFMAGLIVAAVILLTNVFYCHPWGMFKCDLRFAQSDPDRFLSKLVAQDGAEYLPVGVKILPKFMPLVKLAALSGKAELLETKEITPLHYQFMVVVEHAPLFCFKSFYFPGWVVKIDGHEVDILKDNPFGVITFSCPQGVHQVEVYFGPTPLRQWAGLISIFSLCFLLLLIVGSKFLIAR